MMVKFIRDNDAAAIAERERSAEATRIRRRLQEIRLQRLAIAHLAMDGFQARKPREIVWQAG